MYVLSQQELPSLVSLTLSLSGLKQLTTTLATQGADISARPDGGVLDSLIWVVILKGREEPNRRQGLQIHIQSRVEAAHDRTL